MFGMGLAELMILPFILMVIVAQVLPIWLILAKAGFPGWYSLSVLFPPLAIAVAFYVAFAEWPALRHVQNQKPKLE